MYIPEPMATAQGEKAAVKVRVFKKLATDPIARDPRVPIVWRVGKAGTGVRYHAVLTGNEDVRLYWRIVEGVIGEKTRIRQEPRAPTAQCTLILMGLLDKAQACNPVDYGSLQKINELVLRPCQARLGAYHAATFDALRLWQQLAVSWGDLVLPPPIAHIEVLRSKAKYAGYRIRMDEAWVDECLRSKAPKLKLPLPLQATPMNMILKTWVEGSAPKVPINPFFFKVSGNIRCIRSFAHIPLESWLVVRRWYTEQGANIDWARYPYTHDPVRNRQVPSKYMQIQVTK